MTVLPALLAAAACSYAIKRLPAGAALAPPSPFDGAEAGEARRIGGVRLRWCPAGTFTMGSPPREPGRRAGEDQVEVMLSQGFWAGQFEVTQGEWKRVMGALPPDLDAGAGDDFPVYAITFDEAEDFIRRLTDIAQVSGELPYDWEFRLPTEAQWEYAARAGTATATSLGPSLTRAEANVQGDRTVPVGSYHPNPWGLYDVHGNVSEWTRDWAHDQLPGGVDPDLYDRRGGSRNQDGSFSRIRRGGCYADQDWACRSAMRVRFEPDRRHSHVGLRVVAVRR